MSEPKVYRQALDELSDDPHNPNVGTNRGRAAIDRSVRDLGAARSLVADANGFIVAGNKTAAALRNAGVREAVVVEVDGSTPVVVKRTDWDLKDPRGKARQYAVADNRATELNLSWDIDVLERSVLDGVDLVGSGLFSEQELARFIQLPEEVRTATAADDSAFDARPAASPHGLAPSAEPSDPGDEDPVAPAEHTCPACGHSWAT